VIAPFTNPTALEQIAAQSDFRTNSVLRLLNIQLDGPLRRLPDMTDLIESNNGDQLITLPDPTAPNVCGRATLAWTPNECLNAAVRAIVDLRLQNIALLKNSGADLVTKYAFSDTYGQITTSSGTCLLRYAEAQTRSSPMLSARNTLGNPVNTRLRAAVAWERRGSEIAAASSFTNGCRDTDSQPNRNIDSYTTADLKFSYRFGESHAGWLSDATFAIDVRNVLNRATPFVNNPLGIGYDPSNGNLVGRLWSLSVRKIW
jgi:hypothetical protein